MYTLFFRSLLPHKNLLWCLLFFHLLHPKVDITTTSYWDAFDTRAANAQVVNHHHAAAGFFAEMNKVLGALIYHDNLGIRRCHVQWTHGFFPYKDDPDGNAWDLYFEPIENQTIHDDEVTQQVGGTDSHEIHDQVCVAHWTRYDDYLPYRTHVNSILQKYIKVKQHILDEVEEFYQQHLQGKVCIGVHVRNARAHQHEAPHGHPGYHVYQHEINQILAQHPHDEVIIFFASDSHKAVNYFKSIYGDKLVHLDTYRAQGDEDPALMYENGNYWYSHPQEYHQRKPGYRGGKGILMDCLLLAKCDYFIHITSSVATNVCFFNPYIKSIFLPRSIGFRPCRHYGDTRIKNPFINPI